MELFIYSDESGVFDKIHNDYFVFAGVIFLSKEEKDSCSRKYIKAERDIRSSQNLDSKIELKAAILKNEQKGKLYRSLNHIHKFGAVIHQKRVLDNIFTHKKSKQRYLDYAYKIALKRKLEDLIATNEIIPEDVEVLHLFIDEHTTATDGRYELKEALEQEFKLGTFTHNYSRFFPPIFPNLKGIELNLCSSNCVTLVRAADIIANKLYYHAKNGITSHMETAKIKITHLPFQKT